MIFRLFSFVFLIVFALVGTVAGNALRMALDKNYRKRYSTPDTGDLIITGVLSNSIIAAAIALFSGARLFTALIGGAVLTALLGDRLDRDPFQWTLSEEDPRKKPETLLPESIPTNGINTPSDRE